MEGPETALHHEDGMADAQVTVIGPREARASERVPVVSFRHRALRSAPVAAALQARATPLTLASSVKLVARPGMPVQAPAHAGGAGDRPCAPAASGAGIGEAAARTCNEGCCAWPLSHDQARVPCADWPQQTHAVACSLSAGRQEAAVPVVQRCNMYRHARMVQPTWVGYMPRPCLLSAEHKK